jgi:CopG family transcriptional regulator / antitoxin EndoAI
MAHNRINITLPAKTLQQLDEFTSKGGRSSFIDAAIQAYISQIQQENLRQQLKEGAICRAERDLTLADDWLTLEEEAWPKKV